MNWLPRIWFNLFEIQAWAYIVKLQAAKPAMIEFATQHAIQKIPNAPAAAIHPINPLEDRKIAGMAFGAPSIAKISDNRAKRETGAQPTVFTAVDFSVKKSFERFAFTPAQLSPAITASVRMHGARSMDWMT